MAKTNKVCYFCGKKYYYCPTCRDDIKKPSWYTMWCSEQCKNLDNIVAAHRSDKITTEEAKKRIEKLNINVNDIEFARETLKKYFNKIMNYKTDIIDEKTVKTQGENVEKENNESVKKPVTKKTKIVPKSKVKEKEESNDKDSVAENK